MRPEHERKAYAESYASEIKFKLGVTLFIWLLVILAGCNSVPGLYFEAGAGYVLPSTDKALLTDAAGDNPTGHFAVGYEFEGGSSCEINHWSHVFQGGPFNSDPEYHQDVFLCKVRLGGRR